MIELSFDARSVNELFERAGLAVEEIRTRGERALSEEAEAVMANAKENLVPVDEGVLRGTGHVEPPNRRGNETLVALSFGGPAAPYAVRQHEDPQYQVNREIDRQLGVTRVGQWKFLEQPVLQAIPGFAERMRSRMLR